MTSSAGTVPAAVGDEEDRSELATIGTAALTTATATANATATDDDMLSKRRKELFGDCALIEIIHLHDCLRGALKALEADVNELAAAVDAVARKGERNDDESSLLAQHGEDLVDLERRVAGRFKVIWSVFRAHSSAEDEFIWPALQSKTKGRVSGNRSPRCHHHSAGQEADGAKSDDDVIVQEEYEEDHADEERMFSEMDTLLAKLREVLLHDNKRQQQQQAQLTPSSSDLPASDCADEMARAISERTRRLAQHLMIHLEKEETKCMPLVVKHLSKSEIHELVGKIMGKRSADTIAQIMTMAVQNLDQVDREEMVKYMKQSMAGTFFDRWLLMSGWGSSTSSNEGLLKDDGDGVTDDGDGTEKKRSTSFEEENHSKRAKKDSDETASATIGTASSDVAAGGVAAAAAAACSSRPSNKVVETTSQAELEKLIRAIASNPALSPAQKNTTIQGLRDSVWKSNQREKQRNLEEGPPTVVNQSIPIGPSFPPQSSSSSDAPPTTAIGVCSSRTRRETPPSKYYKATTKGGKLEMVWDSYGRSSSRLPDDGSVPLFSAAELAPSYHDGAAGAVLGCPHYARACKLRHPKSGRLYTCRLCCEQQRELPMRDQDEPLDRYEVKEVMCMKCNTLQPAEDRCINSDCESGGKPFAKYFCRICHLYDDGSRPIFHCPYCNTCRLGLGLGVDFRHCMRCNACVSLSDDEHHCIPQKLQGDCPICHDRLFQSTEPLRGLKCGHVMHLSCFTEYRRGHSYTCPLCMRSMEDMSDYFAMLDTAVRMQPMPSAYLSTLSNIYCQDCGNTGQVQYHFVGQKCSHCGSYNTREMGRVHNSPGATQTGQANNT